MVNLAATVVASKANDAEEEQNQQQDIAMADSESESIWESLPKTSEMAGFRLHAIDFDKDIDEHNDFVT